MYYLGEKNHKDYFAFTYMTIIRYLENKITGKDILKFFISNDIKSIAIYGVGTVNNLGKLFYEDIKDSEIEVSFMIDKNYQSYSRTDLNIPIVGINDIQKRAPVDAIVLTPVFYASEITDDLVNAGVKLSQIISLTDIVFGF
ncbi:MAG: hypothetical protein FWC66_04070 [Oscillospiraceae bacterium]|nr:hypothetical protein [Oscillospiraceae bacterium]